MNIKYILFSLSLFLFTTKTGFCQASETTAKLQKVSHPAFTIRYSQPADIVSGAIQQRLKKDGISSGTSKGIITSVNVHYPVLASIPVNLYFDVENAGRKGKNGSTVTLFISKENNNFINSGADPEIAKNAILYLDSLQAGIAVYALQQQVIQQQKIVDAKAKDYRKLLKASQKLQSKQFGLQKSFSSETNPAKQNKFRNKIRSLDKKINRIQANIKSDQHDLLQAKDQLSSLQQQLSQATTSGKS